MQRLTMDFGIDLGTTNSEIAVIKGNDTEIFKTNDGNEYTPSAVYIDGQGVQQVGIRAKNMTANKKKYKDAQIEFKRTMGTDHVYAFPASGMKMTSEQLSAEILKSLRGDVQQRGNEIVTSAAIGVPSIFDLTQNKATMKAAELAGISCSALIQEPIAAAMAYSFQRDDDRVFWMVFDLGGGTFDVALINRRDNQIKVVNHGGDRFLGGKDIDWAIVNNIIAPAIQKEYKFTDFRRDNENWEAFFNKMKLNVEASKIRLSRVKTDKMEPLEWKDDISGQEIYFEYDFNRNEIEPFIEETVSKSLDICRNMLKESNLSTSDIEKVILVGGPTLTPLLREMLANELKVPLDYSIDPITAVARGAAIFASTQKLEQKLEKSILIPGQYILEINYEPVVTELESDVGGTVFTKEGESIQDFTIEFVDKSHDYRSGKIKLTTAGTFIATLQIVKGEVNEYNIELRDSQGNRMETIPDRFIIRYGTTVSEQNLQVSFGVALANGQTDFLIKKSETLPARNRGIYHTTHAVKKGESTTFLRVPILQGENQRKADSNLSIGNIDVSGDVISRDLPSGSEVEVTLRIDQSQQMVASAYVPILDQNFEVTFDLKKALTDYTHLKSQFDTEKIRLTKEREKLKAAGNSVGDQYLNDTQINQIIKDVEINLAEANIDPGACTKCNEMLIRLKAAIDELEYQTQWPNLVAEGEEVISSGKDVINKHGNDMEKTKFASLENEIQTAIYAHDQNLLQLKTEELHDLVFSILIKQPGLWVAWLEDLEVRQQSMKNIALANQLVNQGHTAIENNDFDGLKSAVRQLIDLLPPEEQEEARNFGSTIMKLK